MNLFRKMLRFVLCAAVRQRAAGAPDRSCRSRCPATEAHQALAASVCAAPHAPPLPGSPPPVCPTRTRRGPLHRAQAGREVRAVDGRTLHAGVAEGAPVVARRVPGHEVPAAANVQKALRLQPCACCCGSVRRGRRNPPAVGRGRPPRAWRARWHPLWAPCAATAGWPSVGHRCGGAGARASPAPASPAHATSFLRRRSPCPPPRSAGQWPRPAPLRRPAAAAAAPARRETRNRRPRRCWHGWSCSTPA